MEYYWKPIGVYSEKDALLAGSTISFPVMYIGQAYVHPNVFDVGFATKDSTYVQSGDRQIAGVLLYFNVFCTTTPDKFEWVNTTTTTFDGLNKDILIPGGSLSNGTKSYVGRVQGGDYTIPGSIRLTPNGAFLYCLYGVFSEYQVLKLREV
ncbi:uncharacterized protein LOC123309752 [Coccinella septempunctata]|uniref:uncharacterized protein LOC123309752 n=1 Tax=Coccinella septempunctata TaxID=41139 RepID=UPI001D06EEFA|nr:uncharacterized protein LOC123309752 [Coccinella septempunctata]